MASDSSTQTIQTPYEMGEEDGAQMAWEWDEPQEVDEDGWDEALINAVGIERAAELFGVEYGTGAWHEAARQYNLGAAAGARRVAREMRKAQDA